MNIGRKRRLEKAFLLLLVVFVREPLLGAEGDAPSYKETKAVKAVVLRDFPPQYSMTKDGKPDGFAIDVMEQVAKIANLKVHYIIKDEWKELFDAVKTGEADLMPNQGITEVRKKYFAFTSPVETFPVCIFVRKNAHDIKTEADLSGRKVAAVELNVGVTLLEDRKDIQARIYNHIEEALLGLLSGQVDGLVYPEPVLMGLARNAGLDERIKKVGSPLVEIKRAISVRKGNAALLNRLDNAVKKFVASEDYKKVYVKWYGRPKPYWTAERVFKVMIATIFIVVVGMLLWRYLSVKTLNLKLRRARDDLEVRVKERTKELEQALKEVKTLSGFLPICAHCKKIRDDQGYWNQIEAYIKERSDAEFTHSICPECQKELYSDLWDQQTEPQPRPDE